MSRRRLLERGFQTAVLANAGLLSGCSSLFYPAGASSTYELVVYGGTPGGIMAALAGSRSGLRTALIEPTQHVGGMLSSGLGQTDSQYRQFIGGLAAEFFRRVGAFYKSVDGPGYSFEPHVAESIFTNWLASAQVDVLFGAAITSAFLQSGAIQHIELSNGVTVAGSVWVDASYEGDLLAQAGVSYRVGREAREEYGEPHAGWARSTENTRVSPFQGNGAVIPFVSANPDEVKGQGDAKVMAYTYRCCTTTDARNMVPFPKPPNYDPGTFVGLQRSIASQGLDRLSQIVTMSPTVENKFDLLRSENPFSVNYIGGGWSYPEATTAKRKQIVQAHYNYVAGWLFYVANDPSVPSGIQAELRQYGLAKDEFQSNANWPYQMYVREARRMIGRYVVVESDLVTSIRKADSVAIGTWYGDCHPCDLYRSGEEVMVEGELDVEFEPYEIPYGCLLPREGEAANLAVVCCPSSSHVGFSSLRVEPTFMMLGEAAGVAASLATDKNFAFSAVDVDTLQATLASFGGRAHV